MIGAVKTQSAVLYNSCDDGGPNGTAMGAGGPTARGAAAIQRSLLGNDGWPRSLYAKTFHGWFVHESELALQGLCSRVSSEVLSPFGT